MGHNNPAGGWFMADSKYGSSLDKLVVHVEKAIYATIGRCLLKARVMVIVPPLGN